MREPGLLRAPALCLPLFTGVRGIGILGSSHTRSSEKFPYSAFCEVHQLQRLQLSHNTRRYRLPVWVPGLSGWGYAGVLRPYIVGLLVCLPAKSPRESSPSSLGDDTRRGGPR